MSRRGLGWAGGLLIASIIAFAAYDLVRSYDAALAATGRELDTHARIIAEQTARSMQAVDVVLRHLARRFDDGSLSTLRRDELHAYLKEQAVGFGQVDGFVIIRPDGRLLATSYLEPAMEARVNVADTETFQYLSANRHGGPYIDSARVSTVDGKWLYPISRRLESRDGAFAGIVAARGRIEYFQEFYEGVQLGAGTRTALVHRNGTLLARFPPAPEALGKRLPPQADLFTAGAAGERGLPLRAKSPIDGADRFGVARAVPDYPMVVVVTRDTSASLAAWRANVGGAVARTLALSALAALLLYLLMRQLVRVEEARCSLTASEQRFALAVDGSNDGIVDWDIVNDRMYSSRRAMQIVGLDWEATERPRAEWREAVKYHPDDAARVRSELLAFLAGTQTLREVEYRVDLGNGNYRWIRHRQKLIRDAAGKPLRLAGSVSDIDAQKRAAEALRASEEQYRAIFDGTTDALVLRDELGRIVDVNPAFLSMNDLTREQVFADPFRIFAPPARQEEVRELYRRAREGETLQYTLHLERHGGERATLAVRLVPILYRGRRHSLSLARDVTAEKRAEQALRESEERYQLAVAGANQGLWDWDLGTDRMFLSPRAQEFMGLAPSQPLRPRREWIALSTYHADDVAGVREAISRHLRGATPYVSVEYRLRHATGSWHWYRQRGVALRDAAGRPYRMAGSMEDITAQKADEARRADLEGQLLQAKKLEAIGTLAGGIAHDFNNILAAILGYGEMAQKNATPGSSLRRHLDAVVNAGLRAKSLVERILAFSRSGIGERSPVHVQSIVAEALELIRASLPPGIRLEKSLHAGEAAVLADPTQIHQVVMNLCANAAQAMKGEGLLAVSLDAVEKDGSIAATSALAAGRYVRLVVRDTGAGIAGELRERIFDPFFTTKEVGVGTGLGLSLVHGIVTDLGGGIEVVSAPGAGATFTIYLPLSGAAAAPAAAPHPSLPLGQGEAVLLVDDEEALVRLGEEMIAGLGYEPAGFTSGAEALRAFRGAPERFGAVLSDESMPGLVGSQLAKEIRALRDVPVVLMSGMVTASLAARAAQAGVQEVLTKPLVERDIARALARAFGRLEETP